MFMLTAQIINAIDATDMDMSQHNALETLLNVPHVKHVQTLTTAMLTALIIDATKGINVDVLQMK